MAKVENTSSVLLRFSATMETAPEPGTWTAAPVLCDSKASASASPRATYRPGRNSPSGRGWPCGGIVSTAPSSVADDGCGGCWESRAIRLSLRGFGLPGLLVDVSTATSPPEYPLSCAAMSSAAYFPAE